MGTTRQQNRLVAIRTTQPLNLLSFATFAQNQVKQSQAMVEMVFSSRFRIEAKEFVVSVNYSGIIKLSEWGSKISATIRMGRYGAVWMVNMVDKMRVTNKLEEFVV